MPIAIQLVPKPLWGISACNLLARSVWERIRRDTADAWSHKCGCCGLAAVGGQPLICHEVWRYDDGESVATLVGLRMQCRPCDAATHMGRAMKKGYKRMAVIQLCKVNKITPPQAAAYFKSELATWRKRNELQWRVAVAPSLLERYPQLTCVERGVEPHAQQLNAPDS